MRMFSFVIFCDKNKEFSGCVADGKPVILAELLCSFGIVLPNPEERKRCGSVCKKCARKIVNCYKLYSDTGSIRSSSSAVTEGKSYNIMRCDLQLVSHPQQNGKEQLPIHKNQEIATQSLEENRFFGKDDQYSNVQASISDLRNLPTDTDDPATCDMPPIIKVRATPFNTHHQISTVD